MVTERIRARAERAGCDPEAIRLVLVTKEVGLDRIRQAYDLGMRDFGENRVQDLTAKAEQLPGDIRWHFIGHLQTNKVKHLIGHTAMIHSCDRLELARELQKQAERLNQAVEILIQVNASGETTKHGFSPKGLEEPISEICGFSRLKLCGLMTIGPNTQDEANVGASFHLLKTLREQLNRQFSDHSWQYLSMGMSSDFEIAIEEGANLLRIGSAVFGERSRKK